jgi:selenocysteine lyase/cysteine desulfurase
VPSVYAAAAGLDLLHALGPAAIGAQISRLTARMVDGARSRGFAVVTPDNPERRGALVVVRCTDATALVQRIEARGIVASARGTGLRVSFHAYNNDADVDAVLAALDADAALVSRAD